MCAAVKVSAINLRKKRPVRMDSELPEAALHNRDGTASLAHDRVVTAVCGTGARLANRSARVWIDKGNSPADPDRPTPNMTVCRPHIGKRARDTADGHGAATIEAPVAATGHAFLGGAIEDGHDSLESGEMWSESEAESEPEEEDLVWGSNTFSVPALSRQFSRMGGDFDLEHSTPR